jgi:hypothetical protein
VDAIASNLLTLCLAVAAWVAAGLGVTLALVPRLRRAEGLLLAPLLGLCLLSLIGLFQITVLLIPLTPLANLGALVLLSLLFCAWRFRALHAALHRFRRRLCWLLVLPLAQLVVFAALFQHEGFHLLVGASDQLQYCQNTHHILEEMHTGSPLDVPVARQDHYVYEFNSRLMPYWKRHRRGAEVLLATTAALTGLSPEQAFPVTVGCAFVALGTALGFVGRVCLHLSWFACHLLQAVILGSFCLVLLHVQGSLALLISLPQSLVALALVPRLLRPIPWRWVLLTGILVSGLFSVYSEPALVAVVFPAVLLVARQFLASWSRGFAAARRFGAVCLVVAACAPVAVYTVAACAAYNLAAVCHQLGGGAKETPPTAGGPAPARQIFSSPAWTQTVAVLGVVSYYDASVFNARVAQFVAPIPWAGCAAFMVLVGSGLCGYLMTKNRPGPLFALVLAVWGASAFLFASTQDFLRFYRSVQYALPYALVGLVVLACRRPSVVRRREALGRRERLTRNLAHDGLRAAAWVLLLGFLFLNGYAGVRTFRYLASHDAASDPTVLRFNDRAASWQRLRDELDASQDAPVLISGFRDTIRPFMIACAIRFRPHVLGESIYRFWPVNRISPVYARSDFNTRLSEREYQDALLRQSEPWSNLMPRLTEMSVQAVVPVGHGRPEEWGQPQDVYAPRTVRFANVGDVVYRKELSVELAAGMVGPVGHDAAGPYRILSAAGPVPVVDADGTSHQFCLEFEGAAGDVRLRVKDRVHLGRPVASGGRVRIEVDVAGDEAHDLALLVERPVQLRSIAWIPTPSSSAR